MRAARALLAVACLVAPLVAPLLASSAADAGDVPNDLVRTRYGEARTQLSARGWQPASGSADPGRCARGFEALCAAYPETEYCAGEGLARCVLLWRDGDETLIELRTVGRLDPVVELVRCRARCPRPRGEPAPRGGEPRVVRSIGRPS